MSKSGATTLGQSGTIKWYSTFLKSPRLETIWEEGLCSDIFSILQINRLTMILRSKLSRNHVFTQPNAKSRMLNKVNF